MNNQLNKIEVIDNAANIKEIISCVPQKTITLDFVLTYEITVFKPEVLNNHKDLEFKCSKNLSETQFRILNNIIKNALEAINRLNNPYALIAEVDFNLSFETNIGENKGLKFSQKFSNESLTEFYVIVRRTLESIDSI